MPAAVALQEAAAPDVSVVVVAFRRADLLRACLDALASHASTSTFEVVVVANGAVPEVRAFLTDDVAGATVVRSSVNLGFAGAANLGASAARGALLVLLNDDAVVADGWLDALVATATAHPAAAAVVALAVDHDDTVLDAGGRLDADGMPSVHGRGQPLSAYRTAQAEEVEFGSGAALLVRRQAWDAVGGLDTAYYPAYFEDVDLCMRLRRAGWQIWFEPAAIVRHTESASSDPWTKGSAYERNRPTFLARWGPGGSASGCASGCASVDVVGVVGVVDVVDVVERANDFHEDSRLRHLAAIDEQSHRAEAALAEVSRLTTSVAEARTAAAEATADAARLDRERLESKAARERADDALARLHGLRSVRAALAFEGYLERHSSVRAAVHRVATVARRRPRP